MTTVGRDGGKPTPQKIRMTAREKFLLVNMIAWGVLLGALSLGVF
jgi:hypothetical protein